jgi:hypothetical protein
MTDIAAARAVSTASSPRTSAALVDMALKLTQSLEGVLNAGESAKAEVVTVKEQGQSFQLMLRLTLDNGRQTTVETESPRPIAQGTALAVTALSQTRLLAALQSGGHQPINELDLSQLPAGTIIQGRVLSSQIVGASARTYQVIVQLLDGAAAGSRLNIETGLNLKPGSLLTARVDGSQALSFLPLSGRLNQLEVEQQLNGQLGKQGSLGALFNALGKSGNALPEGVRAAAEKLLAGLPDVADMSDAKGVARALGNSGAQMETRLLAELDSAHDLKANVLRLISQLSQQTSFSPDITSLGVAQALPGLLRSALGALGQSGARQLGESFPIPARLLQSMEESADLEGLLKLAAAAISRLQSHQLSGLAQTMTTPEGNVLTTWQTEIPMRDRQDIVPIQVKLQREELSQNNRQQERGEMLWRIELAFDIDPLGPLQVQAQLFQGVLSSHLWAERQTTVRVIGDELGILRERLLNAGLTVGELECRQGTPPRGPRAKLEQRWIDDTA